MLVALDYLIQFSFYAVESLHDHVALHGQGHESRVMLTVGDEVTLRLGDEREARHDGGHEKSGPLGKGVIFLAWHSSSLWPLRGGGLKSGWS